MFYASILVRNDENKDYQSIKYKLITFDPPWYEFKKNVSKLFCVFMFCQCVWPRSMLYKLIMFFYIRYFNQRIWLRFQLLSVLLIDLNKTGTAENVDIILIFGYWSLRISLWLLCCVINLFLKHFEHTEVRTKWTIFCKYFQMHFFFISINNFSNNLTANKKHSESAHLHRALFEQRETV